MTFGSRSYRSVDLPFALHDDERDIAMAVEAARGATIATRAPLDEPGPIIIAVSGAMCRTTGYTREELVGQNPRLLQGPLTNAETLNRLRDACERGDHFIGETVNYRKDGTAFLFEWVIDPVRDSDGRVTHFISSQRELTQVRDYAAKWLEAEMRARAVMERANLQLAAITEAIAVLEKTKRSFRSPELGKLREKLIQVVHATTSRSPRLRDN